MPELQGPDTVIQETIDKFFEELRAHEFTPTDIQAVLDEARNLVTFPDDRPDIAIEQAINDQLKADRSPSGINQAGAAFLSRLGPLVGTGIVKAIEYANYILEAAGQAAALVKHIQSARNLIAKRRVQATALFNLQRRMTWGEYRFLHTGGGLSRAGSRPGSLSQGDINSLQARLETGTSTSYENVRAVTTDQQGALSPVYRGETPSRTTYQGSVKEGETRPRPGLPETALEFIEWSTNRGVWGASYNNLFDVTISAEDGLGFDSLDSKALRFACVGAEVGGVSLTTTRDALDLPLVSGATVIPTITLEIYDYAYRSLYNFFYAWYLNFYNPHKRRFVSGRTGKYKNVQIDVYTLGSSGTPGQDTPNPTNYTRTHSITGVNCIIESLPGQSFAYSDSQPFSFKVSLVPSDTYLDFVSRVNYVERMTAGYGTAVPGIYDLYRTNTLRGREAATAGTE